MGPDIATHKLAANLGDRLGPMSVQLVLVGGAWFGVPGPTYSLASLY